MSNKPQIPTSMIRHGMRALVPALLLLGGVCQASEPETDGARQPRIVNIYNFIRNSDYRLQNSEAVLFEATQKQIELIKPTGMPVTWALQYDALINPKYQALLKEQAGPNDEIAAWWEVPRQLAEKAGLKWRGHDHDWDSTANVGFSPGFSPDDRRKLVDAYMDEFKKVFGDYPKTVGSWYIDEVTLEYMARRYGIIASCNCKDQIGTDGYTLWGGYWNQAYYPSRVNSYMPAQTKSGQLDVPIFRMLGSDPIYQYGTGHGISSLEPVYGDSGGSPKWVGWFMKNLIEQPCLAFGYTQAGQENSFGWNSMKAGLTMQVELMEKQAKAGEIRVMTLADAGRWFKKNHALTPPTSMVYLDDWKNENRRSVWYNSRFYRTNILWENGGLFIRDTHRFDEKVVSVTHGSALTERTLAYGTLPVMDGARWSGDAKAGIWPVLLSADGGTTRMATDGPPEVRELNKTDLGITQPLVGGGKFYIVCRERNVTCTGLDKNGDPLRWAFDMVGGGRQKQAVRQVKPGSVSYRSGGVDYELKLSRASGAFRQLHNGAIRILPNPSGKMNLELGEN